MSMQAIQNTRPQLTNNAQRGRMIQALLLVKAAIAARAGQTNWICHALINVTDSQPHLRTAAIQLMEYITASLDGEGITLGGWLFARDKVFRSEAELRACRLQWIDWMINCLKEDMK